MPGSVHVPIDRLRDEDDSFRTSREMRDVLRAHGVTPDRRVVIYCTIGNRASQAWFALTQLLGYPDVGRLLRLVGRVGHPSGHRGSDRQRTRLNRMGRIPAVAGAGRPFPGPAPR